MVRKELEKISNNEAYLTKLFKEYLPVFVVCLFLFPSSVDRTQALSSEYKVTKLFLKIGCSSDRLNS